MKLDEKKRLVEELKDKFSQSKVLIVVDYKGLDVEAMNEMRKKLREVNVECRVAKNTLLLRAADQTEIELIKDSFKGPNAVAVSYDDPVAPAKVLVEFAKDNKKANEITVIINLSIMSTGSTSIPIIAKESINTSRPTR